MCKFCERAVAKSAHALRCSRCEVWVHVGCGELLEEDYLFLRDRSKYGFCWFCDACHVGSNVSGALTNIENNVADKVLSSVTKYLEAFKDNVSGRLASLEAKVGAPMTPPQFSDILKETLEEQGVDKHRREGVEVTAFGKTKTVLPQQVLVVKPKDGVGVDMASSRTVKSSVQAALRSIPVNSCRERRKGGLVIKFPSKECKEKASTAIEGCLGRDSQMSVSEPKKLTPKMTVVGIPKSFPDEEITSSIAEKSADIKDLLDSGCKLDLCFTKEKGEYKHAVIKLSPEIRSLILRRNGQIYVGLSSCKAYDRFWVTQCYHCQGFGHISSGCSKKNDPPTCSHCAGRHESKTCSNKSAPCCCNCSAIEDRSVSVAHFASSVDCPSMLAQRQRIIENTDLSS